jgi:hypothetical protein
VSSPADGFQEGTSLKEGREVEMKRTIFLIIAALLVLGLALPGCSTVVPFTSESTKVTALQAQSSGNVTTYDGDLIIDGYDEFVIENCTRVQKGNIYVKDYGKLTVRNAELRTDQTHPHQYEFVVKDYGTLAIEKGGLSTGSRGVSVGASARLEIDSSEISSWIWGGDTSELTITRSTIAGLRISEYSQATIFDSTVGFLQPVFDEYSIGAVDSIRPGTYAYWSIHKNETLNVPFDLTLVNSSVNCWGLRLCYESEITVSESEIEWVELVFGWHWKEGGSSGHLKDLVPSFYGNLDVGFNSLKKTDVKSWFVDLFKDTSVSVENCVLSLITLHENAECWLTNSQVGGLAVLNFLGTVRFNKASVERIDMYDSSLTIQGDVELEGAVIEEWLSSDVTRDYDLTVVDSHQQLVSEASLTLDSKDGAVIWNGTTDSQGRANFDLTFTDNNYTDTLGLEVVKGNLFDTQNVSLLSDTPIVLTVLAQYNLTISSTAGGNVTTPGQGTFTYNEGKVVNLLAFVKWTGDVGTIADVNAASTRITMNGNYSITANFEEQQPPMIPYTGCFIATAAYGTPMAEEIQILRQFRDEYLLTNPLGQGLVDIYYRISPPIADFITDHPSLKPIVRAGLMPAVDMCSMVLGIVP